MTAAELRREAGRLIAAQRSLAAATIDENGTPSISLIPFAPVDGAFGIVVSRLAAHTANLLARRPASVLLIDAEQPDAYARVRLAVGTNAQPQPSGSPQADAIWSALEARQGETTRMLRALPDFEAIALEPTGARLILGFASAHDLAADAIRELLR